MNNNTKSNNSSDKLLKGCAIGCGTVLLIVILAAVGLYTYISHKVRDTEELDRISTEVEQLYGTVNDFTPYTDITIPAERIRKFISVRDSLINNSGEFIEAITKMSESIEDNTSANEDPSFWEVVDIIKSGVGLIPYLLDHYYKRSFYLRESQMGFGEYYYLYILTYYSYLGKSPSDGPAFPFTENNKIEVKDEKDLKYGEKVLEEREVDIRHKSNEMFRKFFTNFLDKSESVDNKFRKAVEEELSNLKKNKTRLPWENELPESLKNSFEPFKEQLESSYKDILNPLEFKNHKNFK